MSCKGCEELRAEVLRERDKAKQAQGALAVMRASASLHVDHGVTVAIDWIRRMSRRELVAGGIRIGDEVYRHVALSVARYLEERLASSHVATEPGRRDTRG